MTNREKLFQFGGLAVLVTLAWMTKPEDIEHYIKGQGSAKKGETLENTDAEKAYVDNKKKAKKALAEGKMTEEEMEEEFDPKADEVISKKQTATNMYAIRYYKNKKGDKHSKPNGLARTCMKAGVTPSTFILEKSYALFENGVGSFSSFKKNVTDKLVHKSVTNKDKEAEKKERIRQAAVILSCCAVGRFQILPIYHFEKKNWPTSGEEGLRAMYNFIRSTERQISVFKGIISGQWSKYKDVGLVAVAYYAGGEVADAYKANPNSEKFNNTQYGGHSSINAYANSARAKFNRYKAEVPGLQDIDYAAMCMESNETGPGIIYNRARQGIGISSMKGTA